MKPLYLSLAAILISSMFSYYAYSEDAAVPFPKMTEEAFVKMYPTAEIAFTARINEVEGDVDVNVNVYKLNLDGGQWNIAYAKGKVKLAVWSMAKESKIINDFLIQFIGTSEQSNTKVKSN